jgi:methylmalonyl-CoA/ethylmalonyl-CoA epimerase
MNIEKIGQIAINVKDLPRASAFYRYTLGMRHLFDAGPTMSFFQCGEVRIMLAIAERPEFAHAASILYYKVADLQGSCAELMAKGVRFDQQPTLVAPMADHDLWMAFIRDTEDNPIGLMMEAPRR